MFVQLKNGGMNADGTIRSTILNSGYQIVESDPVEPSHFFRRVLSDQHVPSNFTVVNL